MSHSQAHTHICSASSRAEATYLIPHFVFLILDSLVVP